MSPAHQPLLLALLGLAVIPLACDPEVTDDDDDDVTTGYEIEVELSEVIPTVATVRWISGLDDPAQALVEFGPDTSNAYQAPVHLADDGTFEAVLVGIHPSTEAHLRVVEDDGIEPYTSEDISYTTGPAPTDLIEFNVETAGSGPSIGGFFVSAQIPGHPVIFDPEGQFVWWFDGGDVMPDDGRFTRAYLSHDRRSVVCLWWMSWFDAGNSSEFRLLVRVSLDGTEVEVIPVPGAHHDFVELPDGTLTVLMYDPLEIEGEVVDGDKVVEIAPDGTETTVWSVWDHVPFDPELAQADGQRYGHFNALDYHADTDTYTVGSRDFATLFHVDRATGETLWRIGSAESDWALLLGDQTDAYSSQHQFEVLSSGELPHGVLMFDNGPTGAAVTRAAEYVMDHGAGTMELSWAYQPEPPLEIYALGDVTRLPSGNTLVTWSTAGQVTEVTPAGEVVWQASMDMGGGLGYLSWVPTLYVATGEDDAG